MTDTAADALLKQAFEHASSGMLAVDAGGRIVLVNREVERLFGYTRGELIGRSVELLVPARLRDAHAAHRETFARAPQARPMGAGRDLFGVRKDGSQVPVEIGLTPIATPSGMVVLASIVDISARRVLEERLRQAERMHTIGTLALGIAHDFNNILRAIVGYTELARASVAPHAPAAADLAQVIAAARRGQQIVERILAFGRPAEGTPVPVAVDWIVEEALELLRASLPSTIEIVSRVDPETPRVAATETELHQVLMNLASNAAQAMWNTGGILEVTAVPFRGDEAFARAHPHLAGRPCVRLRVADTGPGMPPEIVERVFEPFFTTKGVEGTGLGLPVVLGIAEAYGGAVELRSRVGKGTTVDVYLPAVETEAPPVPVPEPRRPSVLFVDDEPALAALGRRQLEAAGFRVSAHTSSLGALEDFRAHPDEYDVIVTDNAMPKMSGAALAAEIRKIRPSAPILIVSGLGSATRAPAESGGPLKILRKPHAGSELVAAVRALLEET